MFLTRIFLLDAIDLRSIQLIQHCNPCHLPFVCILQRHCDPDSVAGDTILFSMRENYCYKLTFEVGGDFIVDHNNSKCEDGDAGFSDETLHLGEYGSSSGNEVTIVEGTGTD